MLYMADAASEFSQVQLPMGSCNSPRLQLLCLASSSSASSSSAAAVASREGLMKRGKWQNAAAKNWSAQGKCSSCAGWREGVRGVGGQLEEKVLHASEKLEQNLLASKHKMEL